MLGYNGISDGPKFRFQFRLQIGLNNSFVETHVCVFSLHALLTVLNNSITFRMIFQEGSIDFALS